MPDFGYRPRVYTVYMFRSIPLTSLVLQGTTNSSAINFDSSNETTGSIPMSFNASRQTGYTAEFSHAVYKLRFIFTLDGSAPWMNVTSLSTYTGSGAWAWSIKGQTAPPFTAPYQYVTDWVDFAVGQSTWGPQVTYVSPKFSSSTGFYQVATKRLAAFGPDVVSGWLFENTGGCQDKPKPYQYACSFRSWFDATRVKVYFNETGTLSIQFNGTGPISNVLNNTFSDPFDLVIGDTRIDLTFTPSVGSPVVYLVWLSRGIPTLNVTLEGTTNETAVANSTGTFVAYTPAFNISVFEYSLTVPHDMVRLRLYTTFNATNWRSVTMTHWVLPNDWGMGTLVSPGVLQSAWVDLNVGSQRWYDLIKGEFVNGLAPASNEYYFTITRLPALTADSISTLSCVGSTFETLSSPYTFVAKFATGERTQTQIQASVSSGTMEYSVAGGLREPLLNNTLSGSIPLFTGQQNVTLYFIPTTGSEITYYLYFVRNVPLLTAVFQGTTNASVPDFDNAEWTATYSPRFNQSKLDGYSMVIPHNIVKARMIITINGTNWMGATWDQFYFGGSSWSWSPRQSPAYTWTSEWISLSVGGNSFGPRMGIVSPKGNTHSAWSFGMTRLSAFADATPGVPAVPLNVTSFTISEDTLTLSITGGVKCAYSPCTQLRIASVELGEWVNATSGLDSLTSSTEFKVGGSNPTSISIVNGTMLIVNFDFDFSSKELITGTLTVVLPNGIGFKQVTWRHFDVYASWTNGMNFNSWMFEDLTIDGYAPTTTTSSTTTTSMTTSSTSSMTTTSSTSSESTSSTSSESTSSTSSESTSSTSTESTTSSTSSESTSSTSSESTTSSTSSESTSSTSSESTSSTSSESTTSSTSSESTSSTSSESTSTTSSTSSTSSSSTTTSTRLCFASPWVGSGTSGNVDGVGVNADFENPFGSTLNDSTLYVTDADGINGNRLRSVDMTTLQVTTLAGDGTADAVDGMGLSSSLSNPSFVTTYADLVYFSDDSGVRVYQSLTGNVGTLVQLSTPGAGLVATRNGTVYVNAGAVVYTVVNGVATGLNTPRVLGSVDGNFTVARFRNPSGMVISADENVLYIAEPSTCKIRKIDLIAGRVSTLVGAAGCGDAIGAAASAKLQAPAGLYLLGSNLYIVDAGNKKIKLLDLNAMIVTQITRCDVLVGPQTIFVLNGLVYVVDNNADVLVTLEGLDPVS